MQVSKAEYKDGALILTMPPQDAFKFIYQFKPGEYDIAKHVNKRSDRSNRYAWELIGKLATALNQPAEAIYRHAISEIGGATTSVTIADYAATEFARAFKKGHKGRIVEKTGEGDGKIDLLLTYGSSDYNQQQMTQLIDNLVQDCKACGIETADPGYIKSLLEAYG